MRSGADIAFGPHGATNRRRLPGLHPQEPRHYSSPQVFTIRRAASVIVNDALAYDAVLLMSFGGPEHPDDVEPFLRNVTSGRSISPKRLEAVARQYAHFGGKSPLNEQCRRLRTALSRQLQLAGYELPVYWGNRNWKPYVSDVVTEMTARGHRRVLAVATSAYSSYSGCRQYLEDIEDARTAAGRHAPVIHKVRAFYNHPEFIEPFADAVSLAKAALPPEIQQEAALVFTAHSIPVTMARGCLYEEQLQETARLITDRCGFGSWHMAWQSRSGPPSVPWLEPDICDLFRELSQTASRPSKAVVVAPIGFVTDHMEVMWDLDVAAAGIAAELGIEMVRATTPGTSPDGRFVAMLQQLIEERLVPGTPRRRLGSHELQADSCEPDCCPRHAVEAPAASR